MNLGFAAIGCARWVAGHKVRAMPIQWTTVPREPFLAQAVALFDERAGVAVLGVDGVGKTTLAAQIAERLGQSNPVLVIGTGTQSEVPFGAFGPLVDITEIGKPAALIHAALDSLLAQTNNALIIVDDAHLLDPLSATLVYQLAQARRGRLIVTARSTPPIPAAIAALWQDGLLERIDLTPLDGAETASLLAGLDTVAAPAPSIDAAEMYRRSVGNPLHLRLMVATGDPERSLPELIDRYLAALPAPAHDVLGYLSVREPLGIADLVDRTVISGTDSGDRYSRWAATGRNPSTMWWQLPRRPCGWAIWV